MNILVVDFKCILFHSVVEVMLLWSKFDNLLISGAGLYFGNSNEYVSENLNELKVLRDLRNDIWAIVVQASAAKF